MDSQQRLGSELPGVGGRGGASFPRTGPAQTHAGLMFCHLVLVLVHKF